ncbi:MAG: DUF1963 domain-containing protein [Bacteroidales bacterium]|jgi:uncharacterized protein YwqG|nr:DUF1963 domain-containing protein [Bacteroidales bacterium]
MKKHSKENKKQNEQRRLQNQLINQNKSSLSHLVNGATKIIATPSSKPIENTQFESHVGGQPYFEKIEEWDYGLWPKTKKGKKLDFVLQIFNDGNIAMPQNIKLVQFFLDMDNLPTETSDDGWEIIVYEELNPENFVFIENPKGLNGVRYREFEFKPTSLYGNEIDSRLGGSPHWLQFGTNEFDEYYLLLQIDSFDIGVTWHDCGVAYIFYEPKSKKIGFRLESC